jgi:hypothetical protein
MTPAMTEQHIPASPVELHKLAQRITEANEARQASETATGIAADLFTMFCEGKGLSGATFVAIEHGQVIVSLPEQKPELVKDAG